MKKLFLAFTMLLASCQAAAAGFTGEECAALGAMTAKFAYYHELWYYNHDNEAMDVKTGIAYKDEVPDLPKEKVLETVRQWSLTHPPFDQPKYLDAALNAVEVAYAVTDPDDVHYMEVGQMAEDKCFKENPQPNDVIKSEK